MNATDRKILEKIFAAEIGGRLPCQLKSKHLPRLEQEGLVQLMEIKMGVSGDRFACTVKGWELTEFGRMTYCTSCK